VLLALGAVAGLLETLEFDGERMRAAADTPTSSATDLAEHLVEQGTPFREAHGIVGGLVRESLDSGADLADLVRAHPALGEAAVGLLAPGMAVTRRTTRGGAGPEAVHRQMERFRARLDEDGARIRATP